MWTVLVCGGRDYRNPKHVRDVLDDIRATRHKNRGAMLLIHGDAIGADSAAGSWASLRGVDQVKFPANWSGHGKSAGPRRNALMLKLITPDLVVAFPGGRGTADMVARAEEMGIEICEIETVN